MGDGQTDYPDHVEPLVPYVHLFVFQMFSLGFNIDVEIIACLLNHFIVVGQYF